MCACVCLQRFNSFVCLCPAATVRDFVSIAYFIAYEVKQAPIPFLVSDTILVYLPRQVRAGDYSQAADAQGDSGGGVQVMSLDD